MHAFPNSNKDGMEKSSRPNCSFFGCQGLTVPCGSVASLRSIVRRLQFTPSSVIYANFIELPSAVIVNIYRMRVKKNAEAAAQSQ